MDKNFELKIFLIGYFLAGIAIGMSLFEQFLSLKSILGIVLFIAGFVLMMSVRSVLKKI